MKFFDQVFLALFIGLTAFSCNSQTGINQDLKKELDAIMFTDQAFRRQYDPAISDQERRNIADSLKMDFEEMKKNVFGLMKRYDAENIRKVEAIIVKYGYPGRSLVGEPTQKAAFLVIQHSDKIPEYLPLIKSAAERKELDFTAYALMLDRYLMNRKEMQIYGSQGFEIGGVAIIWPIQNPSNVNKLRMKAGFKETVEEYSRDLFGKDFSYRSYTLEEAEKIFSGYIIHKE